MRPKSDRLTAPGAIKLVAGDSRITHRGKAVTARPAVRLARSLAGKKLRLAVRATDRHEHHQLEPHAGVIHVANSRRGGGIRGGEPLTTARPQRRPPPACGNRPVRPTERNTMTWTVACFCGQTFTAPLTCCPRCASPLPTVTVRPQPHGGHFDALINAEREASRR